MRVDSVTIEGSGQVVMHIERREVPLPEGTYQGQEGELVTVSQGAIVDFVAAETMEWPLPALQAQLDSLTEMVDGQTLAMQHAMGQQTRAMQLLSNIMKAHHDTLKSIINNIR